MTNITIKEIPINDRPRERLLNVGTSNLSDEELLAIVLNSGTKNISVKNLSSFILSKSGSLANLKLMNYYDLIGINGVGKAKACVVLALCELCLRMNRPYLNLGVKLTDPSMIFNYFKTKISDFQEQFFAVYLDARKKIISTKLLFVGTVNHSLVHPRDVFKEAYKVNASFLICVHNHPSGDVTPSLDDEKLTKRFIDIGNIMGIKLVDHVIVSSSGYYSFLENGKI